MKLKVKDYSLISNEWIDGKISELKNRDGHDYYKGQLHLLQSLKQQLIPSEKLADKSWDESIKSSSCNIAIGWGGICLGIDKSNVDIDKENFLNSEIEIE